MKHICKVSSLSTEEALRRLIAAGLDSIPGGGAEVLSDRVREIIGIAKGSTADWLEVMEVAHGLGHEDHGHHDVRPRGDARGAHRPPAAPARPAGPHAAASPRSSPGPSSPTNTALAGDELTSFQYLRTLAVARVMLDNFPNVQASWVTQGGKIGQVSLRFGANDFGSLMIEENVVSAAGAHFRLTEAEIARNIQDAGFVPKRRTMHYEIVGDPYCWTHATPEMPAPHAPATSLAG